MIKFRFLAVFTLVFMLLAVSAHARSSFSGKVVNVADGDTITVLAPGNQQVKVRLYGIDCPEKKQAFGQRARQFTASLAAGKQASVEIMDTDRYGRTVGLVTVDGVLVNQALVANGFAWVYPQFCKKQPLCGELSMSEGMARSQKKGLWREQATPPWEWRKAGRKK